MLKEIEINIKKKLYPLNYTDVIVVLLFTMIIFLLFNLI